MLDILDTVDRWLQEGKKVALATVVETWGSSPRQAGAKMAVTEDMAMVGSVSGGCVETAVVEEALASLRDGKARLLNYGVSDDAAWTVGLACGGKIAIFVEPLDVAWWEHAAEGLRQHHAITTVTKLDSAAHKLLIENGEQIVYQSPDIDLEEHEILAAAGRDAQDSSKTQRKQIEHGEQVFDVMIDAHHPQPKLIMIGGVHIAMSLALFANHLGYRVALIDPRDVFATDERFPGVETILHNYPDKALPQLGIDAETYIAVLTHDPKIDDPALTVVLNSSAAYIGVLSSKRTHEKRIERLTQAGMDPHLLDRVFTPIGLEIGAKTPEEIALCIMAEIVAVRSGERHMPREVASTPSTPSPRDAAV